MERITLSQNNGKDGLPSIVEFIALASKIIDEVIAKEGIKKDLGTFISHGSRGSDSNRHLKLAIDIRSLQKCLSVMKGAIGSDKVYQSQEVRAIEKIKSDAKIDKSIGQWNKTVNRWPRFGLPFIGAKQNRPPKQGLTGEQVRLGKCTIVDSNPTLRELTESKAKQTVEQCSEEPVEKMHPICTHSQGKRPCCIMSHSTLKDFFGNLLSRLDNTSEFDLNIDNINERLEKYVQSEKKMTYQRMWYVLFIHNISWTCQILNCPGQKEKNKKCGKRIPLSRFAECYSREEKKEVEFERCIVKFGWRVVAARYNTRIVMCHNKECKRNEQETLFDPTSIKTGEQISCILCDTEHSVHSHKFNCPEPECKSTMCSVCKQVPYHEGELCTNCPLGTKICPNKACRVAVDKTEGCDHITCPCGTHWCFRCNQTLDSTRPYDHRCLSVEVLAGRRDGHYWDDDLRNAIGNNNVGRM